MTTACATSSMQALLLACSKARSLEELPDSSLWGGCGSRNVDSAPLPQHLQRKVTADEDWRTVRSNRHTRQRRQWKRRTIRRRRATSASHMAQVTHLAAGTCASRVTHDSLSKKWSAATLRQAVTEGKATDAWEDLVKLGRSSSELALEIVACTLNNPKLAALLNAATPAAPSPTPALSDAVDLQPPTKRQKKVHTSNSRVRKQCCCCLKLQLRTGSKYGAWEKNVCETCKKRFAKLVKQGWTLDKCSSARDKLMFLTMNRHLVGLRLD